MLFTSYSFIAFFLSCFVLYYLIPKRFQWVLLLSASCFFYAQGGIQYLVYMAATSLSVYLTARRIQRITRKQDVYLERHKELSRDEKKAYKKKIRAHRKWWMLVCLLFNLGILAVLKYTDFAVENINRCLALAGVGHEITYPDFILPIGISFYTFQAIGYLLDVYWKRIDVQQNFFKFSLFVSFFPQLGQGPISRYGEGICQRRSMKSIRLTGKRCGLGWNAFYGDILKS